MKKRYLITTALLILATTQNIFANKADMHPLERGFFVIVIGIVTIIIYGIVSWIKNKTKD